MVLVKIDIAWSIGMFYKLVNYPQHLMVFGIFIFRSLLNLFWHLYYICSVAMLTLRPKKSIQNNHQNQLDLIYRTSLYFFCRHKYTNKEKKFVSSCEIFMCIILEIITKWSQISYSQFLFACRCCTVGVRVLQCLFCSWQQYLQLRLLLRTTPIRWALF